MDFISLHEKVTEGNNLFYFLLDMFPFEKKRMRRTEEYHVETTSLIVVTKGIVAKKTKHFNTENGIYSLLVQGSILWLMNHEEDIVLENEHDAEIAILNKSVVFEKLDRDGLLSHLLLEQLIQKQKEYQFQSYILHDGKARIAAILLYLAALNKEMYSFDNFIIPYNTRFTKLASYGYCSRSLVAKTVKELESMHVIKKVDKKIEIFDLRKMNQWIQLGGKL